MMALMMFLVCVTTTTNAFHHQTSAAITSSKINSREIKTSSSSLKMGLFDFLSGGGQKATASHILLTGKNAEKQCEKIKEDVYKKAMAGAGPGAGGVDAVRLMAAFSAAAKSKSTCPSKKNGGSLGTFKEGEMVPEFDEIAFKEAVGVIHGPVKTEFGTHLIIITERE